MQVISFKLISKRQKVSLRLNIVLSLAITLSRSNKQIFKSDSFYIIKTRTDIIYTFDQKATNTETEETITHEQLVLSLRNILTSSGKFAEYCIPMLMEKLESDIPSARLAAMDVFVSNPLIHMTYFAT